MRSRKTAAVVIMLCLSSFFGVATTAKSATKQNVLTAIHKDYQPESLNDLDSDVQNEIICLALNQYHEARGTPEADIMAVGFSTRNRVNRSDEKSYCDTIWEKGQYIWTKRAVQGILPKDRKTWLQIVGLARKIVTNDDLEDTTHGADSFYSKRLHPSWARRSHIHLIIGQHMFVQLRSNVNTNV